MPQKRTDTFSPRSGNSSRRKISTATASDRQAGATETGTSARHTAGNPERLAARVRQDGKAVRILDVLALATGLTVVLEENSPVAGEQGPTCRCMVRTRRNRISECLSRRAGLLNQVAATGSSAVLPCPVGAFCLAAPVYANGAHVATICAGGFTHKMGASKIRADAVREFLHLVADELGQRVATLLAPKAQNERMDRVFAFVHSHAHEHLSLDSVARRAGVSRQHLVKLWKQHTGVPLNSYLNSLHIEHAKVLLKSRDCKVIEIAMDCGFGSLSQFNRAFLRATGLTPTAWGPAQQR